ncbi:MAG: DUF1287 domain-containing protein [Planctomycetota bacterium]
MTSTVARAPPFEQPESPFECLSKAALAQVGVTTLYDPNYAALAYPGGDVPLERGVCADVIVRAFRGVGIDLQKMVHEDMLANFAAYPRRWNLKRPDANIDHRRVLNLMTWFQRQGWELPITSVSADYQVGDMVAWDLGNGLTHIGMVVKANGKMTVVHNIGQGARMETVLFSWPQIGHYRWK